MSNQHNGGQWDTTFYDCVCAYITLNKRRTINEYLYLYIYTHSYMRIHVYLSANTYTKYIERGGRSRRGRYGYLCLCLLVYVAKEYCIK